LVDYPQNSFSVVFISLCLALTFGTIAVTFGATKAILPDAAVLNGAFFNPTRQAVENAFLLLFSFFSVFFPVTFV
jgi:hypothetical protein